MRVFGTKKPESTDEDRVAAARLSAVAARFKDEPSPDFEDAAPSDMDAPLEEAEEPDIEE